jgi:hypothetical protein
MVNPSRRLQWGGAIAIIVLIILTLAFATQNPVAQQGSTYSRVPGGYGAWYAYLQEHGALVNRWEKPLNDLMQGSPSYPNGAEEIANIPSEPITIIQIYGDLSLVPSVIDREWIKQGNEFIQLGFQGNVSDASFRSDITSDTATVRVETRRRYGSENSATRSFDESFQELLGDRYGAVVWQEKIGKGRVVFATTPYLAANAYQDFPGNFAFLATLAMESGHPIWIDEYLHGYRDTDTLEAENENNVLVYLAKTPIAFIAIQIAVIFVVLIWGYNQRLGSTVAIAPPSEDNSQAYIHALAQVLRKSQCTDFVYRTILKHEQLYVQQALGLGRELLTPEIVSEAWQQKTGRSATEFLSLFQPASQTKHLSEQDLLTWLTHLAGIRRYLS